MSLPIKVRLTLWYGALLTATIVALSTFLVLQLQADLRRALDKDAMASSVELARAMADERLDTASRSIDDVGDATGDFEEEARAILSPSGASAQLLDADGHVVESYGVVAGGPALVTPTVAKAALEGSPRTFTASLGEGRYRVRLTAVHGLNRARVLVVTESLEPVEEAVERVVLLLLVAGPAALVVTTLASYWLARKAMRPVERMTSDAQEIGIDQLHERVAVPSTEDETRELAVTLNAMLDRIEQGVDEKHRMIADASHELRTPLAVMRTELDVSLRSDQLSGPDREVLHSVREEVGRMTRTVDNLLTLALADEGRLELLTVTVNLRRVAEDAVRSLAPMADARSVQLLVTGEPTECQADPQRLRLALTNLLENAVDFSPPAGEVRVDCWRRSNEVGVTVTDQGPGIAPEDRERVFDRFFRVDSARGRDIGGSGLGLAICRELAHAHGGRVWVESQLGAGSAFSLALPALRV